MQLYTVQCSSDIDMSALVQAQCDAFPLDCSQPSALAAGQSISEVIDAALAGEVVSSASKN